jgi:hypothetical protein
MFPLIYPSTRVKIAAVLLAAVWVTGTVWAAPFNWLHLAAASFSGALLAGLWFRVMHGPMRFGTAFASEISSVRRFGWAALMLATGFAASYLHSHVDPLLPAGEWHRLLSNLFIVTVWPALMWPLQSLGTRAFNGNLVGAKS